MGDALQARRLYALSDRGECARYTFPSCHEHWTNQNTPQKMSVSVDVGEKTLKPQASLEESSATQASFKSPALENSDFKSHLESRDRRISANPKPAWVQR